MAEEKQHDFLGGGSHPYCELLCITEGQAELEMMDERFDVQTRHLLLIPSHMPHRLFKTSDTTVKYWYMELETEQSNVQSDFVSFPSTFEAIRWNRLQSMPCRTQSMEDLQGKVQAGLSHMFDLMEDALMSSHPFIQRQLVACEVQKLFLFISLILQYEGESYLVSTGSQTASLPGNESKQLVQEVMRYMECTFRHEITLQTLADLVHLDPSYFIRLFKEQAGVTPYKYLQQLRLNAAKSLLLHTKLPITEVAEQVGFPSIHYFSRRFKEVHGVSPSEYRLQQAK